MHMCTIPQNLGIPVTSVNYNLVIFSHINLCAQIASSNASARTYSKYFVMAEFTAAVAFALSCVKQEHLVLRQKQVGVLQNVYEGRDVVVWFPTGYSKLSASALYVWREV